MLQAAESLRQYEPGRQDGDGTHGHVHIEDPAPAPVIGNPAAQGRPNNRGKTEDRHDQALPLTALGWRKGIADDSHGNGHQCSGSQSLNAPVDDQLGHVLAGARQSRAGQEDDHATDKDYPPAINVGQLAIDWNRDSRGEQVGCDDPGVVLEAAQVGDDAGQGSADDRLVERSEQHTKEHADNYQNESLPTDSCAQSLRLGDGDCRR